MLAVVACCAALAGCGGGDDEKDAGSGTDGSTPTAAAPTRDGVLRCLNASGVPATRQSGLEDDDQTIGIDTSSGRTVISFAKTAEQAELRASVSEQYGKVVREGLVTTALDAGTLEDEALIRRCMAGKAPAAGGNGRVAADQPTAETVRQCLKAAGVAVRDKEAGQVDRVVIAHPGGLMTTIDFEVNEGVAKAVETASKKFGKTLRVGTIVASLAPREQATAEIRTCITG